jgi:hypothetical protein
VLLKCFSGCKAEEVVAALGLSLADLFPPETRQPKPAKSTTSHQQNAVYLYRDKDGVVCFKMERRYGPDGK